MTEKPATPEQIEMMKGFWAHYGKPPHTRPLNATLLKKDFLSLIALIEQLQPVAPTKRDKPPERPTIDDEEIILQRLYDGDQIVYSQDGDMAWFSKGDRAFVGDTVMDLREKGCLLRMRDPEDRTDNYRGMAEYDTISAKGVTRLREITALPWDGLSARSPLGDLYEVIGLSENVWATRINGTTVDGWSADERRAKAVAQGNYDFKRKEARK